MDWRLTRRRRLIVIHSKKVSEEIETRLKRVFRGVNYVLRTSKNQQ